jgi:hypothetical protein
MDIGGPADTGGGIGIAGGGPGNEEPGGPDIGAVDIGGPGMGLDTGVRGIGTGGPGKLVRGMAG